MIEQEFKDVLEKYRGEVKQMADEHAKYRTWDAWYYNGITAIVLLCTALLATLPPGQEGSVLYWLSKVFAVLSMFLVALDRTLGFGPRWRFHIEMENSYRILLDQILALQTVEPKDATQPLNELRISLASVRAREHNIPGVSASSDSKVPAPSAPQSHGSH